VLNKLNLMLFCFFLFACINVDAGSIEKTGSAQHCLRVNKEKEKLDKWMIPALHGDLSLGCPSQSPDSALFNLEIISRSIGDCGDEALGILIAFYSIFAHHPNYMMCGLIEKEDILIARFSVDGKICSDQNVNNITSCFLNINKIMVDLKTRGEKQAAFELAKKIANSNDVTGLSQMTLGIMYGFGEGTQKNLSSAIQWLKISLEKIVDNNNRKNVLLSLAVFHEEIKDYSNARLYAQQCALMGDLYCKKGLVRLTELCEKINAHQR